MVDLTSIEVMYWWIMDNFTYRMISKKIHYNRRLVMSKNSELANRSSEFSIYLNCKKSWWVLNCFYRVPNCLVLQVFFFYLAILLRRTFCQVERTKSQNEMKWRASEHATHSHLWFELIENMVLRRTWPHWIFTKRHNIAFNWCNTNRIWCWTFSPLCKK